MRIVGFQSFGDSADIVFADGINLIVGPNNPGKSSILRALIPALADDRHRNAERWEFALLPPPMIELTIEVSGLELRRELFQAPHADSPVPENSTDPAELPERIFAEKRVELELIHRPNIPFSSNYPSHRKFVFTEGIRFATRATAVDGTLFYRRVRSDDDGLPVIAYRLWQKEMFYFSAERMNIGECPPSHVTRLAPDASNLPAVLFTLNGDRGDLYDTIVRHLREIFSTVGNLSVRPTPNNQVEIRVWPTEARSQVDLSFPLRQSGTGIAQVISILTAVLTVEDAVIIVDEINSFLHPAAVKSLLRILQTHYPHHQYIISTHAPEVISFSNPKTVHLVKRAGYESSVTQLNLGQVDDFREVADSIGVSMADVFAADRIIWVEGPTEELCFPLLYQQATGHPMPRGTIFTSVMATGDFLAKRRDKELVYQIYRRLSQVAVPLVVSVAFSFDSENLTPDEITKIKKDSGGLMRFLPRRLIECYCINPAAIEDFITSRCDSTIDGLNIDNITAKLIELAGSKKFLEREWRGDIFDEAWLARVDAANLISAACAELSEHLVTFNKKSDTLALLKFVQDRNPAQLEGLASYVKNLVQLSE